MKNRRGFLAALGLGAGASVLGLPATAQAWGRRRRRGRDCCDECGGFSGECGHCGSELARPGHEFRTAAMQTMPCACACPQYLYFQASGVYYYKCLCCPINNTWVDASSGQSISLPAPCPSSSCIGSCTSSPAIKYRIYNHLSAPGACEFYLDPDSLGPDGKTPHAEPFIKGIDRKTRDELNKEIDSHPNVIAKSTLVFKRRPVQYDDSGVRYVALFDVSSKDATGACDLHIGIEVSKDATITAAPQEWGIPFKTRLPHYHHVYVNGFKYHVVTGK